MYKFFRRVTMIFMVLCISFSVIGCGGTTSEEVPDVNETFNIVDSDGNSVTLTKDSKVISLYGSYAECWMLSGGSLVGVTQDAIDERHLELSSDVKVIGTVKEPNLESIVELNPDYVIMSKDLAAHESIKDSLTQLHIGYGYFKMDTFDDYAAMMEQFCKVNGRDDLYDSNVVKVKEKIDDVKKYAADKIEQGNAPKVLLIRAYTTGIKAKSDDNLAGVILKEFGCNNIVDSYPSMLEDLSVEKIIQENPDYIFVLTMGDESKALAYMDTNVISNPAWSGLSAVEGNKYVVLPKELFHYKPNNRWGESYEYLANILFGQR